MWSKRRKRFRRYYDPQKHVWYLIRTRIERRMAEALARALDDAIINGTGGKKYEYDTVGGLAEVFGIRS